MMMKRRSEMTEVEALKNKYRDGLVPILNPRTNKNDYV